MVKYTFALGEAMLIYGQKIMGPSVKKIMPKLLSKIKHSIPEMNCKSPCKPCSVNEV